MEPSVLNGLATNGKDIVIKENSVKN